MWIREWDVGSTRACHASEYRILTARERGRQKLKVYRFGTHKFAFSPGPSATRPKGLWLILAGWVHMRKLLICPGDVPLVLPSA